MKDPSPHSTKPQYFLSYAVLGSVGPFISVLIIERGLTQSQIGSIWAVSGLSVIFTPILVTLLADTAIPARFLMAAMFFVAGAFLVGLVPAYAFWPILILYSLHQLALQPTFPLQDGIHFAAQAMRRERGLPEIPYHTVRVWGTIGYIIPSAALYFFLTPGRPLTASIYCGIAVCAIGAIGSFFLPHTPAPPRDQARSKLPTLAAARAIGERHVLIFCIAMFLLYMASMPYYLYYPIYMTEHCGIEKRFVGLIQQIGTVGEVFYVLAFAWLVSKITLRRVMYLGALTIAMRMVALAAVDHVAVAIAVQFVHGLTVLTMLVAPPIFINQHASDEYRNSIQGLYTMAVIGGGRVIGSWVSGRLANHGLTVMFDVAAGVAMISTLLFYFAFQETTSEDMKHET